MHEWCTDCSEEFREKMAALWAEQERGEAEGARQKERRDREDAVWWEVGAGSDDDGWPC